MPDSVRLIDAYNFDTISSTKKPEQRSINILKSAYSMIGALRSKMGAHTFLSANPHYEA